MWVRAWRMGTVYVCVYMRVVSTSMLSSFVGATVSLHGCVWNCDKGWLQKLAFLFNIMFIYVEYVCAYRISCIGFWFLCEHTICLYLHHRLMFTPRDLRIVRIFETVPLSLGGSQWLVTIWSKRGNIQEPYRVIRIDRTIVRYYIFDSINFTLSAPSISNMFFFFLVDFFKFN